MGNESIETSNETSATGKIFLSFLIGGTIGSLITYHFTKRYYSKKADEAINSVTERFTEPKRTIIAEVKVTPDKEKITDVVKEAVDDFLVPKEKGPSEAPTDIGVYAISVDEFVDDDEYDKETLIYYEKDQVLSDQYDHQLFVQDIFGYNWPVLCSHFGDDDEDVLYCRNPKIKTDYEVVMEHKASPETCIPEGDEDD